LTCAGGLEHPPHLRREVLAQLATLRQAEQLVIRHGGPEQVGQPRGQGVLVEIGEGSTLWRFWAHVFDAEEEARRCQDGEQCLRDALLEVLAWLFGNEFCDAGEAVKRLVIAGAAESSADKPGQHFTGVLAALRLCGGRLTAEENALIVFHVR